MEILIILTVGIIAILNIAAFALFDKRLRKLDKWTRKNILQSVLDTEKYIEENRNTIVEILVREGKLTRKETQEIKTRLTQVRKDLNVIEPKIAGNVFKSVMKMANDQADRKVKNAK
jgi:hypothetical protein